MMVHPTNVVRRLQRRLETTRTKNLVDLGVHGNNGNREEKGENESWGDSQGEKSTETPRIAFQNIGPQATNKNELNATLTTQHLILSLIHI